MLMSVDKVKMFITTGLSDEALTVKMSALESAIRKYTNNDFQNRKYRFNCPIIDGKLYLKTPYLQIGDSIQITTSLHNDGLYSVIDLNSSFVEVNKILFDEENVLLIKIEYPEDVQLGAINMLKWDIENRDKVGIQSESISRHSVSYFNMDGENSIIGYPKSLIGFLTPYKKARF
ncbi:MAG: hypothetical protein SOY97_05930 [Candidatus Metalachnospira sp.]|nr:hypothetical protein [Candidatus Metalachnospira sp.]